MSSEQIERAVRRRVQRFDGVFSANHLPKNSHLLICNTDPCHRAGEHWVAMYVDDEGQFGEYFDSFGRPPPVAFKRYLDEHSAYWNFNNKQLQSVASLCFIVFVEVVVLTCVEL